MQQRKDNARFDQSVASRRSELSLSQQELATKTCVDRTYVSKIERGGAFPSCRDMIADAPAGHDRIPRTVRQILKDALALRDARDAGRVDLLLAAEVGCCDPDRRLVKHLRNERDALLTLLAVPGAQATSWRAEQAVRPMAVNRKHWGGNRTRGGADTLQVLASLLRSTRQQGRDPCRP